MQKIKYGLLNRVIGEDLTGMEINMILYLVKICDAKGHSTGVYYQEITKELQCSTATFYKVRDSLAEKGFIEWQKNHSADIDIQLIGNDFIVDGEIVYRDYVNTNIAVLNDKSFYGIKAGAKQLVLELVKRASAGQENKQWYNPFNQYRLFAKKLRVSLRVVRDYFEEIKRWIQVGRAVKEGKEYDVVTVLKRAMKEPEYIVSRKGKAKSAQAYPEYQQHRHYVEMHCRRNGIGTNELQIADTATLMQQYGKKAKALGSSITNMLLWAIRKVNSIELNSINVHKALRNMIEHNEKIEMEG